MAALAFTCHSSLLFAARKDKPTSSVKATPTFLFSSFKDDVEKADSWTDKGKIHFRKGEFKEANEAFHQACLKQPKLSSSWYNLARSYFELGLYDLASQNFFKAHQIKAKDQYHFLASLSLLKGGRIHNAIKHFHSLLSISPDHGFAWKYLGVGYETLQQFSQAKSAYENAQKFLPMDGELIFFLENLPNTTATPFQMKPRKNDKKNEMAAPSKKANHNPLPKSRIFEEGVLISSSQMSRDLPSLLESYHLKSDAPEKKHLGPSPVEQWIKAPKSLQKATPQSNPIPNITLEDL